MRTRARSSTRLASRARVAALQSDVSRTHSASCLAAHAAGAAAAAAAAAVIAASPARAAPA
eukprot:15472472-Alexandrium_andersonii.AAC.1